MTDYEKHMREAWEEYKTTPRVEGRQHLFHLNLAAYMGERIGGLFTIIDRLRAEDTR